MSDTPELPEAPVQADRFARARTAQSTALLEDYAELIADLLDQEGEARTTDMAKRLGVSHATAIKALSRLKREGLVTARPYRGVFLTDAGRDWYTADIQSSKQLFAGLVLEHAPLVRTIVKALENSNDGALREDFFRDLLRRGYSTEDTEKQLDLAIDWGRYGELFDYDADTGELVLGEVAAALTPHLT